MSDTSPRLSLPYLAPAQAQKHVTHNEALQRLDILTQLTLQGLDQSNPPPNPLEGQIWAVSSTPSGVWTNQPDTLAAWVENAWLFVTPQTGWQAADLVDGGIRVWSGSAWEQATGGKLENIEGIGINASYDAFNRLVVASEASLFTHDGAGHQIKINKADLTDTASLLFQTGFSGRAEMGTAGAEDFSIKVSADGISWTDALVLDAATGHADGAAIQQNATDVTTGRLARVDYTYGPGNLLGPVAQAGGVPTGAVIEEGSTADGHYIRFADGTQICHVLIPTTRVNGAHCAADWDFPMPFISEPSVQMTISGTNWNGNFSTNLSRGDIVPVQGYLTTTALLVQVWARSGVSFAAPDTIAVNVTLIGRWI